MKKVTTVHKCDHCGYAETVVDDERPTKQFYELCIGIAERTCNYNADMKVVRGPSAYWCEDCAKASGMVVMHDQPPITVTIEDLIREIVQDETNN